MATDRKEYMAAYRLANAEKIKGSMKAWYQANKGRVKEYSANRYYENIEKMRAKGAKYYQENRDKKIADAAAWQRSNPEKAAARNLRWARANAGLWRSYNAKRHASKVQAVPGWADDFLITEIYELASLRTRLTGVVWHVDHIVPLTSGLVCGLHCEGNLRVITRAENCSKRNYYWPDMP